jgi:hypothetical protein
MGSYKIIVSKTRTVVVVASSLREALEKAGVVSAASVACIRSQNLPGLLKTFAE